MTKRTVTIHTTQDNNPAVVQNEVASTLTLDRIFELEKHARECLQIVLQKKEELKEARKIYDGAVEMLMNTIRKAHEPEFEFVPGEGKQSNDSEED